MVAQWPKKLNEPPLVPTIVGAEMGIGEKNGQQMKELKAGLNEACR